MKIPLYKAHLSTEDILKVSSFLKTQKKLSRGEKVSQFENKFAKYVKTKYAIATNSGTSALHLAVRSLNLKQGDEVITTPFTYIASVNCLKYENVSPVFVDIDPNTLNINVDLIESKITENTKAILIVNIFGLPVNNREVIKNLKEKYNLWIIEDSCESIGSPSLEFPVGYFSDISVYGFHENKQLTTGGEGGMLVTNNKKIADTVLSMSNQGRSNKKNWVDKVILGYNYRMTEMQAVIGISQLKNINKVLKIRENIAKKYYLSLPKDKCPQSKVTQKRSWFFFFMFCSNTKDRDKLYNYLMSKNISVAKHYFVPIYKFPMYRNLKDTFMHCENMSTRILVLPTYVDLKEKEIKFISTCINKYYSL